MKKNIFIKLLSTVLVIIAVVMLPLISKAQPPDDPGGDPTAPIDGGVVTLAVVGASIGIKKLRKKKNTATYNQDK